MPPISSIATSPAVDLSGLPPPDMVPQMDFEARFAAKLARLVANLPEFSALVESDPAIKLLEADSFDEQLLAQACNDAARQMLIAFATGGRSDEHTSELQPLMRNSYAVFCLKTNMNNNTIQPHTT